MKQNISETNKKVAISRWKNEEKRFKKHLDGVNKREYKKFKARLLGFISGDGSISIIKEKKRPNAEHHDISFYPDHESMIPPFIEAFKFLYIKEPKISQKINHYSVKVSSKFACFDLIKTSKVGTHDWTVPFDFLNYKEYKKEWLRAFFDCEAYVAKKVIQVQSVNKSGLFQVKILLEDFNIDSKIYEYHRKEKNWNTNYILCINKKEDRKKYLNSIGFNHQIKQEKLNNQINANVG